MKRGEAGEQGGGGVGPSERGLDGTQSIRRAIALLRAVARREDRGVGPSRLAAELGLPVPTVHRMLGVLASEGFIYRNAASRTYHLGFELHVLGSSARRYALQEHFRLVLEQIGHEAGDTVFLLARSGNDVLCLDRVEGQSPIRTVTINVGARRPLGVGAGSLALIAFLPDAVFEAVLEANGQRYPQFRDLTADRIRELGVASRPRGYVVSDELFHEGVVSVGVPILTPAREVVAAITVSAISSRMSPHRQGEIAQIVSTLARTVSSGLTSAGLGDVAAYL